MMNKHVQKIKLIVAPYFVSVGKKVRRPRGFKTYLLTVKSGKMRLRTETNQYFPGSTALANVLITFN